METKRVIITGGTYGLGFELVKKFLDKGCQVISLGRSDGKLDHPQHTFLKCDFSSFSQIKATADLILNEGRNVDLLINNAGILSSPEYTKTTDGFEQSFQVNFLSHVYLFQILLEKGALKNAEIINTTSPIRTLGKLELDWVFDKNRYGRVKAYSSTKLYMSLFARHLASNGFLSYSFDPGTFRSGIYRAQKPWFHTLYKVGAPFLIHSKHVARDFISVYDRNDRINGAVYNRKGRVGTPDIVEEISLSNFWETINSHLPSTV